MDWENLLHALESKYHSVIDNHVYLVSAIKLQSFVRYRQIDLTLES